MIDNSDSGQQIYSKIFHFTIGTQPSGKIDIKDDIKLVKAALLYADRVKLYSITSHFLMSMKLGDINDEQKLKYLERVVPFLTSKQDTRIFLNGFKRYKNILKNKYPSRSDRNYLIEVRKKISELWAIVKQKAIHMAEEAKFSCIEKAIRSGLVELHTFKKTNNDETAMDFITDCMIRASNSSLLDSTVPKMKKRDEQFIQEYWDGISNLVSDSTTYPLFDYMTSKLVETGIKEKKIKISESAINRGKHSGLAGHLLQNLPLFDQASIDEILDMLLK